MKLQMNRLDADERLRELRYHLEGIVEAADNVAGLVKRMNETYGLDVNECAKVTTLLEVEVFDHLAYHIKKLRAPLRRVQRKAYADADDAVVKATPIKATRKKPKPVSGQ